MFERTNFIYVCVRLEENGISVSTITTFIRNILALFLRKQVKGGVFKNAVAYSPVWQFKGT